MSTPAAPAQRKKLPLFKLAVIAVVVGGGVLLMVSGGDVRGLMARVSEWTNRGVAMISAAGPVAFFTAMALGPAVGVPSLTFILPAGPAFADRLGMTNVVLLSVAASTLNFVLSYWLARRALRPVLEKLLVRLGYQVPTVDEGDTTDMILILRLTPGIPFCVQNYLLGLTEVPFGKFFGLSFLLGTPQTVAFVLFGDALLHGKGRMLLYAGGAIVALIAGTHLLRRHYGRKKSVA